MKKLRKAWLFFAAAGLVLLGANIFQFRPTVVRGPYLQQSSPTGLIIRWRTSWPVKSAVRYGLEPAKLSWEKISDMRGTDHAVQLTGLQPETLYYYEVVSSRWAPLSKTRIEHFRTAPEIGNAAPIRIWVLGDPGTDNSTQRAVRDSFYKFSRGRPADLCLTLGDNAYPSGTDDEYQKAVFGFYGSFLAQTPIWPTMGNHDARRADPVTQSGVYFDVFNLPTQGQCGGLMSGTEAYYSFDYANVHFVALDSSQSAGETNQAMLKWLRQDLVATQRTWTIAFWHHPPYTKGSHDSDKEKTMCSMREQVLPILEAAGVDLVLGGHSHDYERSYLLDGHYGGSDTFSDAMIKSMRGGTPDSAGPYVKPADRIAHSGTVYVVAGSSGKTARFEGSPHPAMCVSLSVAGSMAIDVSGPQLEASFVDGLGKVRDRFTILKERATVAAHSARPPVKE